MDYWYDADGQGADRTKPQLKKWFSGGEEVDKIIQDKFKKHFEPLRQGKYDHWKAERDGRLAFILLCDQFSRNCFRGAAEAFSYDPLAIQLTLSIIRNPAMLSEYTYFEKYFILMPLMHAEDREIGKLCRIEYEKV